MTLPNFLIIGTQKAGTTSLALHLAKHPQVYMSPLKEPGFFDFENQKPDFNGSDDLQLYSSVVTDLEAYRQLFAKASKEIAIGEATTWYMYSQKAAEHIHNYIPNAKLIVILRNPVERAYSAFMHAVRDGRENVTDFSQALQQEKIRIEQNWEYLWHYKQMGYYYVQLSRYYKLFDRSQIKVFLYEDLNHNSTKMLEEICQFLNIDKTLMPKMTTRLNKSGIPQNKLLDRLLKKSNPIKSTLRFFVPSQKLRFHIHMSLHNRNLVKPKVSSIAKNKMLQEYRSDILQLQDLIEKDLSAWLK